MSVHIYCSFPTFTNLQAVTVANLHRTQVVTRLELAALCVRWSPCGRKFAMGSAARCVSVAYRDARNGWWTAKLMRRCHGSSVVAVAWHPAGALLATASSDGRCRVFNARVAGAPLPQLWKPGILLSGTACTGAFKETVS